MPLNFLVSESVPDGIRRMARELVGNAIDHMTRLDRPDKNIHETRKSFKKLRGLLRLARSGLGELCYQRENGFYRDIGKRLAPLRECYVRTRTLGAMAKRYHEQLADLDLEPLKQALRARHRDDLRAFLDDADGLQDLREHLQAGLAAIGNWPLGKDDERVPLVGMARIYRQGRRECAGCRRHSSTEALHDWRKRVKYLWYHTQILIPCWPALLTGQAQALDALGERLGDDHDLADFRAELTSTEDLPLSDSRRRRLLSQLDRDRHAIQRQAFELGARIYQERPAAFADRMAGYWQAWRQNIP